MKILIPLVICLSFLVNGVITNAQKTIRLGSTPKAFQTFYAKFRNAAVNGDKNTIASATHFPFQYAFDAGDEGTFSKNQFIKRFDDIFGGERKIFAQKNPAFYTKGVGYYALNDDWDASSFVFEKKGISYKFTAYIAEP